MNRQTLLVIVGAIVLFAAAVGGAIAFTDGGSGDNVHTMQDGSTMSDTEMDETEMAP